MKQIEPTPSIANTGFTIRRAGWRDLEAVTQLEKLCFPLDAWPLLEIIGTLTLPGVVRLKAMAGRQLVGFISGERRRLEKLGWIATICVHPERRGQGIGRALLATCEARMNMPRVRLTVRTSNLEAVALYQRCGYTQVGEWPRYYAGGEDGLLFEKAIQKNR